MHPLETLAIQMDWAARNMAHNLDFLPDDKLAWKPAPTAHSALEIVNHAVNIVQRITARMKGEEGDVPEPDFQTREQAKAQITQNCAAYVATLRALPPEKLDAKISTPLGEMPLSKLVFVGVTDFVNHHGQITYIQTLLGDTESHLLF